MTKPLAAMLPYFGGKRTLAPTIVELLGPHKSYYEPFCGSAAVLFAKPVVPNETINDLHGDVVNLAMVLASDKWEQLYEAVDRILVCEELIRSSREAFFECYKPPASTRDVSDCHVTRAAEYLAASWIGRNGTAGQDRTGYQIAVRWTSGGGSPGNRWRSAVESVPKWHDRLKGVVVLNRDAFEIIDKVTDESGTVIYCDPPYIDKTVVGGQRYRYKLSEQSFFGEPDDHERLSDSLNRFTRARVVVSYYDHPRLDDLYVRHGWTKLDVHMQKKLAIQNRRGVNFVEAPEVLLINAKAA